MRFRLYVATSIAYALSGAILLAGSDIQSSAGLNTSHESKTSEQILLERAIPANLALYSGLTTFVCDERIERYVGSGNGKTGKHRDTVAGQLSFENGLERYSNLRQQDRPLATMASLDGAWSEGEFLLLLKQTEQLLRKQRVVFDNWTELNGKAAAHYHFDVDRDDSPWDLEVDVRHYTIAFRTDVWLAQSSGEILKIARRSTEITSELNISQIDWTVTLRSFNLEGQSWLLPSDGTYRVAYRSGNRKEWNTMAFDNYHRHGSQVALRLR